LQRNYELLKKIMIEKKNSLLNCKFPSPTLDLSVFKLPMGLPDTCAGSLCVPWLPTNYIAIQRHINSHFIPTEQEAITASRLANGVYPFTL
jgi:hypothetical protein